MTAATLRELRLREDEIQLLRELRLRALHDSPDQFGESVTDALTRSDGDWSRLAATVTPPVEQAAFVRMSTVVG